MEIVMAQKVSKEKSERNVQFAKGGTTKMFGPQKAGPEKPRHTAHATSGDGGKFAKGGGRKMFSYNPSVPATPGRTSAR